ncbi:hypothetical protein [Nitritalea halalkaliphila]|uniref:hypothetical protein n=1 Tax=Nitritalea halalkaliphila TaxID=590849 RepID=UPI001EE67B9A|nr:hypothetical protein [Nitritalea halalkaliphila]
MAILRHAYVEALVLANGKRDEIMETFAGKLTLEYGVLEVSWEIHGQQPAEM